MKPPASFWTIHQGDARNLEAFLSPYSSLTNPLITCTITSPPYWNLKNYGHRDQVGWGQPFIDYLLDCRRIFQIIKQHTQPNGSLWLVVDTLLTNKQKLGRLQPLPFDLARVASDVGWVLRDIIIWKKDKTLPWSGRGRLRNAFEYVLYLVKSNSFKYYADRVRDPIELEHWWVRYPERYNPLGKVPVNVWEFPIPIQGSWSRSSIQHACPLPPGLVEKILLLCTDPEDVVLDPFAGSGVVVAEAERLGRRGMGVELVGKHVRAFHEAVRPEILGRESKGAVGAQRVSGERLRELILRLRVLKYPKVLLREYFRRHSDLPRPVVVVVDLTRDTPEPGWPRHQLVGSGNVFFIEGSERKCREVQQALETIALVKPASKFGVRAEIEVFPFTRLEEKISDRKLHVYLRGQTWKAKRRIQPRELGSIIDGAVSDTMPPILSELEVRLDATAMKAPAKAAQSVVSPFQLSLNGEFLASRENVSGTSKRGATRGHRGNSEGRDVNSVVGT